MSLRAIVEFYEEPYRQRGDGGTLRYPPLANKADFTPQRRGCQVIPPPVPCVVFDEFVDVGLDDADLRENLADTGDPGDLLLGWRSSG